jgi:hypothetical protein
MIGLGYLVNEGELDDFGRRRDSRRGDKREV